MYSHTKDHCSEEPKCLGDLRITSVLLLLVHFLVRYVDIFTGIRMFTS